MISLLFVGALILLIGGGLLAVLMLNRSWGGSRDHSPAAPAPRERVRFEHPASAEEIDETVRALVADGRQIEAIKLVREHTGLGLKEAKDYVDALV
jgi:ribosomal protein L7/L12